jgi:hypothetical protein
LPAIADVLGVPISFFFDDLQLDGASPEERERLEQRETIDLIRLYYAIPAERVRLQFLELVKAVAERTPLPEAPACSRSRKRARR